MSVITTVSGPHATFMDLASEHEQLDEMFLTHQTSLVERDLPAAIDHLNRYCAQLTEHMNLEESRLFPLYIREEPPTGGGVELLAAEHTKIRELLGQIQLVLGNLNPDSPALSRGIIDLLDRESQLKRVMEHHDLRERRFLYPVTDRVVTESERNEILASYHHELPIPLQ